MASYYYLIASLPELRADGDMPLTYSEFLQCCQSNVSDSDYERLRDLTLDSSEGPLLNEGQSSTACSKRNSATRGA
jgi:hypothetical protein